MNLIGLMQRFRSKITKAGFKTKGVDHPIVPIMLGDARMFLSLSFPFSHHHPPPPSTLKPDRSISMALKTLTEIISCRSVGRPRQRL